MLGLPEFATLEDVRRVYRKLALANHPDRGGKTGIMAQINDAYDILTKQKDEYDAWLKVRLGMVPDQAIIDLLRSVFGDSVQQGNMKARDYTVVRHSWTFNGASQSATSQYTTY